MINETPQEDTFLQLKKTRNLLNVYMNHLDKTVKKDQATKRMVFLTALSAYSQNPQNLFLKGPSSIGKTYNVIQALRYFPQHFIWMLGGLSPTALVHDFGTLIDSETKKEIDPIEDRPKKEDYSNDKGKFDKKAFDLAQKNWRAKLRRAYYLVDLEGKILVFLESPHIETLMRLRPVLSHDAPQISYKFTDKPGGGALRTMHVVLKGWPACIFCTTDTKYIEDLATRGFTVTPDLDQQKIKEAINLIGEKKAYPWKFDQKTDQEFNKLQEYLDILTGRLCIINNVVIPYSTELSKIYHSTLSRDMRDYLHFIALIELNCLLNIFNRAYVVLNKNYYWMANIHDFLTALELLKSFEETTRTGIPGNIVTFYHKIIVPFENPANYEDLVEKHNNTMSEKVSKKSVYKYIELLRDIGWVDTIQDPEDKRRRLVYPLKKAESRLYYSLRQSLPFFHEKDLKNWLDNLKKYSSQENIYIINNLVDKDKHRLNSKCDLTKHFIDTLFREEYFLDQLEPKTHIKTVNKPKNCLIEENLQILGSFNLKTMLKEKFERGTQQNFENIVKQIDPKVTSLEIEQLFEKLVETGDLAMDPEGYWKWT